VYFAGKILTSCILRNLTDELSASLCSLGASAAMVSGFRKFQRRASSKAIVEILTTA
jgi:hypothetical protein